MKQPLMKQTAASCEKVDAIIVGAGPAGSACALHITRFGGAVALFDEREVAGGLCNTYAWPENNSPITWGESGEDMAKRIQQTLADMRVPVYLNQRVERIEPLSKEQGGGFLVNGICGRFVVLATGTTLHNPGSATVGNGVFVGADERVARLPFRGKKVAVWGGGDSAAEVAIWAQKREAAQVDLYARHVRAHASLVQQVAHVHEGDGVRVDAENRCVNGEPVDYLIIMHGRETQENLVPSLAMAADGRILVDGHGMTNVEGVFAAGEAASSPWPCVARSVADGMTVGETIVRLVGNEAVRREMVGGWLEGAGGIVGGFG